MVRALHSILLLSPLYDPDNECVCVCVFHEPGAMITGASAAQDVVASLRDTGTGAAATQFARSKL